MSAPDQRDDDERDAWLRQALRHAPDAQAAPPAALSESILAQARAAAAPPSPSRSMSRALPRRRSLADVLQSAWNALARPPVAAGFASVMAATIVGLMWWDRPMDEALPRPRPPSSAPAARDESIAPPPVLGSTQAPSATQSPDATPMPTPSSVDPSPASPKPAPAPARSLARKSEAPAAFPTPEVPGEGARDRIDERKKDRAPSLSTGPSRDARTAESATPIAPARPAQTAAVPAPVLAPAPAPAPAAESLGAGRAVGQLRSEVAADRAEKAMDRSAPPPAEPAPSSLASRQRNATESRAGADAGERERSSLPTSPLAPLLGAIAREPQRWSRLSVAGAQVSLDAAWRDWLADVDAAAAGRWQRTPSIGESRASAVGDDEEDPAPLHLFVDGRFAASLRLAGRTVRIDRALGEAREHSQASLAPDAARRLATARARLASP